MDQKIILEHNHHHWGVEFQVEKENISKALNHQFIAIEHIGSTAIADLSAKPIIDLMLGVNNLQEVENFIAPLSKLQYEHVFHNQFPNRRFFRKGQWRAGTHHLHIYVHGGEEWNNHLLFRNYLNKHNTIRQEYEQLKQSLAILHPYDRVAYTNGKHDFIQLVLMEARN